MTPIPHPVLRKLKLVGNDDQTTNGENGASSPISSTDVLSYLLTTNVLQEDTIKSALEIIRDQQRKEVTPSLSRTIGDGEPPTNDDMTSIRTRHIALRLFYDGANFSGLAQNMGQEEDNSVERALFTALLKARLVESRASSGYSRCGRTDRGVSAAGQVVALQLKSSFPLDASLTEDGTIPVGTEDLPKNEFESLSVWTFPRSNKQMTAETAGKGPARIHRELKEYPYAKILNNLLPPSIRVLGWAPVSSEFSARFSATTRTYRYFFGKRQMDLAAIRDGLKRLIGKHDFRNFCKMDVEKVYNFERIIHAAELVELSDDPDGGGVCYLQILGQAFLWHQIRCIAEVLFMIGRRLESPCIITELLNVDNHPRKPSYNLADEKPLVLHDCGYPNLQVGYSVRNLWAVSCQLEEQWEELTLAAARLRNCINSLRGVSVLREDLADFVKSMLEQRNKKRKRRHERSHKGNDASVAVSPGLVGVDLSLPEPHDGSNIATISWGDALPWMLERNLVPDSTGLNTSLHVSLLERSKGTSYEEKVESLKKSDKRRQKFEENVVKKRKTSEEDAVFYNHMMKQGGKGI